MDLGNAVLGTDTALQICTPIKRPTSHTSPEEGLRILAISVTNLVWWHHHFRSGSFRNC